MGRLRKLGDTKTNDIDLYSFKDDDIGDSRKQQDVLLESTTPIMTTTTTTAKNISDIGQPTGPPIDMDDGLITTPTSSQTVGAVTLNDQSFSQPIRLPASIIQQQQEEEELVTTQPMINTTTTTTNTTNEELVPTQPLDFDTTDIIDIDFGSTQSLQQHQQHKQQQQQQKGVQVLKSRGSNTLWVGPPVASVKSMIFYSIMKFNGVDYYTDSIVMIQDTQYPGQDRVYKISSFWETKDKSSQCFIELIPIQRPEETPLGRKAYHGEKQLLPSIECVIKKISTIRKMMFCTVEKYTQWMSRTSYPPNSFYCQDKDYEIMMTKGFKRLEYDGVFTIPLQPLNENPYITTPPAPPNVSSSLESFNSSEGISLPIGKKRKNVEKKQSSSTTTRDSLSLDFTTMDQTDDDDDDIMKSFDKQENEKMDAFNGLKKIQNLDEEEKENAIMDIEGLDRVLESSRRQKSKKKEALDQLKEKRSKKRLKKQGDQEDMELMKQHNSDDSDDNEILVLDSSSDDEKIEIKSPKKKMIIEEKEEEEEMEEMEQEKEEEQQEEQQEEKEEHLQRPQSQEKPSQDLGQKSTPIELDEDEGVGILQYDDGQKGPPPAHDYFNVDSPPTSQPTSTNTTKSSTDTNHYNDLFHMDNFLNDNLSSQAATQQKRANQKIFRPSQSLTPPPKKDVVTFVLTEEDKWNIEDSKMKWMNSGFADQQQQVTNPFKSPKKKLVFVDPIPSSIDSSNIILPSPTVSSAMRFLYQQQKKQPDPPPLSSIRRSSSSSDIDEEQLEIEQERERERMQQDAYNKQQNKEARKKASQQQRKRSSGKSTSTMDKQPIVDIYNIDLDSQEEKEPQQQETPTKRNYKSKKDNDDDMIYTQEPTSRTSPLKRRAYFFDDAKSDDEDDNENYLLDDFVVQDASNSDTSQEEEIVQKKRKNVKKTKKVSPRRNRRNEDDDDDDDDGYLDEIVKPKAPPKKKSPETKSDIDLSSQEENEEQDDSEHEKEGEKPKRRKKSLRKQKPVSEFDDDQENDNDDLDLDDFIVNGKEEEQVEEEESDQEEKKKKKKKQRSKEKWRGQDPLSIKKEVDYLFTKKLTIKESFEVFLQYIVSCIVDKDFIRSVKSNKEDFNYFKESLQRIEDVVVGKKDILVRSSVWQQNFVDDLLYRPIYQAASYEATTNRCQSCKRATHSVTFTATLAGPSYEVSQYWKGDFTKPKSYDDDAETDHTRYEVGSFCLKRSEIFHQLHHYPYTMYINIRGQVKRFMQDNQDSEPVDIVNHFLDDPNWIRSHFLRLQAMLASADEVGGL
ncbi:hypothetical protein DFA_07124 [Cavenderia fasciculata]|uniref:BAH domain-containing protein n=1 Tax=Cavenderia fasciculata TaxID=261658 RepID=F4PVJ4_CACFS|nr:uncharacterized protein DFA_07124 [Cavenderia fasciculata]EGG20008.1 hypothetical protein DFA_07124 [Cavenderia fasciculata]|eukprot:XP_004366991.1 hypothetical protein DFA_07124 [Cavenderia fasciculata]